VTARERVPGTAILVVSQYVEHAYASELLADRGGGVGYLLKDRIMHVAEFVEAVRRVAGGGTALDPEVVAQLSPGAARMGRSSASPHASAKSSR
jgi:DNA-binding NarL/FixJ family response regulator